MARSIFDVLRIAAVLDKFDPKDPTTRPGNRFEIGGLHDTGARGLRVGVLSEYTNDLERSVGGAFERALRVLQGLGVHVSEIAVPGLVDAHKWMGRMLYPDAAAVHRDRLRSMPESFAPDVRARLEEGLAADAVSYAQARAWRKRFLFDVSEVFGDVDLLISPTTPVPAPPLDSTAIVASTRRLTRHTYGLSMAHLPALSVPCGRTPGGLPIGLHFLAPQWRDELLFKIGFAYEGTEGIMGTVV